MRTRTVLITGGGGAGRSTVAAATAVAASAGQGRRVLLLSADRGTGLDALLDTPLGAGAHASGPGTPEPGGAGAGTAPVAVGGLTAVPVTGVPGLWAARTDPAGSCRRDALDLQDRLGSVLGLLGAAPLDPEEITELPGAEALALLRALRDAGAGTAAWDVVVVDLPPVHAALAMLALPEQLRRYLGRLLPAERQAARALRPVLAQLAGVPMPAQRAYEAAGRADLELAAAQAVIEAAGTTVRLVAEPGPAAAEALRTARTGLALFGHRLEAVIANRILPAGSADPFFAGLAERRREHLKALDAELTEDGIEVCELPHLGREPYGAGDLAALAAAARHATSDGAGSGHGPGNAPGDRPVNTGGLIAGLDRATGDGPAPPPWTVEDRLAADGHLVWRLPLPGARRDGLDLVRRGDELVLGAEGFRRIVPLPPALRRCTVAGAALREGALQVRFAPDPDLWPAAP